MRITEHTDVSPTVVGNTVYAFGCNCGEEYETAEAAWNCRKCRTYLSEEDFANRDVSHWTGEREPTPAELMEPTEESEAFLAMFEREGFSDEGEYEEPFDL